MPSHLQVTHNHPTIQPQGQISALQNQSNQESANGLCEELSLVLNLRASSAYTPWISATLNLLYVVQIQFSQHPFFSPNSEIPACNMH